MISIPNSQIFLCCLQAQTVLIATWLWSFKHLRGIYSWMTYSIAFTSYCYSAADTHVLKNLTVCQRFRGFKNCNWSVLASCFFSCKFQMEIADSEDNIKDIEERHSNPLFSNVHLHKDISTGNLLFTTIATLCHSKWNSIKMIAL